MQTYIVNCEMQEQHTSYYTTLVITGEEKAVVKYLQEHVEDADWPSKSVPTMQEYLKHVREYMEENGACNIWDIHCNGVQLEQYVNDYMWGDEWDPYTHKRTKIVQL